jgi:hypothetical protein
MVLEKSAELGIGFNQVWDRFMQEMVSDMEKSLQLRRSNTVESNIND